MRVRPFSMRCGRSMRVIRAAIGATTINPKLLTCAERLQYEGYLRRKDTTAAIMTLVKNAVPLKEIVRRTGHSRKLVRQVSRGESTDVFRTRQSTLDAHLPFVDAQWTGGCRNGQSSGVACKCKAFKAPRVWSVSGRHDDEGQRRRPTGNCKKCLRRGKSHD